MTDPAHQFSPAFLYNQLQYYDEGSTFEDNLTLLADQGCATLDSIPYNDEDYRTWPGASAYREGIPYRALSYDYLGHGETESIFDAVKAIIASCDVCAVGFPIYRPDPYSPGAFDLVSSADPNYDLPPASDVYLAGYHAVTIVGYDESKFEGTGGYKIVNSWGTAWGDSGFAWLSERFLTTYGFDFYSMTDRIGYSPTSFVHFKVSHPYWWYDNIIVTIGVGSTSTPIWFKILNKRLNRDALIMDRWADITEGEGHLPPTGIKPWWLKIEDHSWDDIGIISIADITSNLTTETSKISLPINCNDNANTFIYFTDKERALFLVSPAATTYQYTCPLGWRCYGYGWQPNDTLCAEYSSDGGATWNAISGAAALPYHSLSYTWDIIKMPYGSNYKARYTCNQDPLTVATMSGTFTIGDLTRYFVNDASQADDVYCIALGNDANDGLTSATPKATVQAILATYDLEPGDTIFVDSGTYNLTADIVVGAADGGAAAGQVRIVGVKGKTILDRGAPVVSGQANMCVQVIADYVSLENLTCRNANFGIYLAIGSDYCVVEDNRIFGCPGNGIYAYLASYSVIQRNIVTQVDSGSAILLNDYFSYRSLTVPCEVKNNIFVSSNANGICVGVSKGPVLKNNIVLASGTGKFCVSTYDALAIEASDYNDLFPSGGAKVGNIYQYEASTLDEWQSAIGWDIHSISADPMFVDPDGPDNIAGNADDDYHLKSTEGRWDPAANGGVGGWVKDDVNSPCIDAGNPADSFTLEPSPNGGRINIGAYGGTAEASKSPASGRWLVFEGAGNREPLHAWEPLHWTARGANWAPGETVRLEISDDSGETWLPIADAQNLAHDAMQYWWDSRTVPDDDHYRFRVVANSGDPINGTKMRDYSVHNLQSPWGPSPADGATVVPINTNLSWNSAKGATSYDVYLWKSSAVKPTSPITNASLLLYNPPLGLSFGTAYNWQIVARNAKGVTAGPEWIFTTAPFPAKLIERIHDYILGRDSDPTDLDINSDGRIDVADIIYVLIL